MPAVPQPIIVLVLAAGQSTRFRAAGGHGHKLDADFAGTSVLQSTLAQVRSSGLAWHLVRPAGGTPGMGDSIALGVASTANAAGWLILPADMPLVQAATLRAVAHTLQTQPASVVVPCYQGQRGHPVGFAAKHKQALLNLRGDCGAKAIVQQTREIGAVYELPVPDSGIVIDVDTPYLLAKALHQHHLKGPFDHA
ncbi:nucleotidyltransferase family protein [Lampropedia puyangensis]|uniref:Nucleotidyltransferase family protein n=1 Tax=Lampropedia puyangensis TaxID=1330072 RepID=A0A4S8ETZ5_9BURK|nr:nucleotidyltransferase family protein [Lampropedia puyangensis]THT98242.1 nucleotidyltransferase family protein [Lampropedia puyangensis]